MSDQNRKWIHNGPLAYLGPGAGAWLPKYISTYHWRTVCWIPGTVSYKEQTTLKPPVKDLDWKYLVLECTKAPSPYAKYLIPSPGNTDPLTVPFPRDPLSVTSLPSWSFHLPFTPYTHSFTRFLRSFTPFLSGDYQLNYYLVHGRSLSPEIVGGEPLLDHLLRVPRQYNAKSPSFYSSFQPPKPSTSSLNTTWVSDRIFQIRVGHFENKRRLPAYIQTEVLEGYAGRPQSFIHRPCDCIQRCLLFTLISILDFPTLPIHHAFQHSRGPRGV